MINQTLTKPAAANLRHYWQIIFHQTMVDIRQESRRYFLGIIWLLLDPILLILIFYFLYTAGIKFGADDERFLAKIVIKIGLWRFFASAVPRASRALIANRGLMNQVACPAWLFPIQSVFQSLIKFQFVLLAIILFLVLFGEGVFSIQLLSFPLVFAVYLLLTLACALVFSAIVPFLPDLQFVIGNGILLLWFLSGVFFDISAFEPHVQNLFYLNPLAVILQSFVLISLEQQEPMWLRLFIIAGVSLVFILLGLRLLKRFSHTYPKLSRG